MGGQLVGSGLNLVVTNAQKGVASCDVSRVVVKTLVRIGRELHKGVN